MQNLEIIKMFSEKNLLLNSGTRNTTVQLEFFVMANAIKLAYRRSGQYYVVEE